MYYVLYVLFCILYYIYCTFSQTGNRSPEHAETNLVEIKRPRTLAARMAARARADGATTQAYHEGTLLVALKYRDRAPYQQVQHFWLQ